MVIRENRLLQIGFYEIMDVRKLKCKIIKTPRRYIYQQEFSQDVFVLSSQGRQVGSTVTLENYSDTEIKLFYRTQTWMVHLLTY